MVSEIFYRLFIDPLLSRVQNRASRLIPDGSTIIDIACGIGTLAMKNSRGSSSVTGIDLSPGSISYARRRARKSGRSQVQFMEMDASDLSDFQDREFDYSTISMAVHQFSPETGKKILKEMARISKTIVVIDYAYPQPRSFSGLMVRIIERMAGKEHNQNFKAFMESGGICEISRELELDLDLKFGAKKNVFSIALLQQGNSNENL